jgi:hypothetical protein
MITTAVMAMTSKTLTTMAAISAAVSLETLTSSNVWAEKKCINLFILSARDLHQWGSLCLFVCLSVVISCTNGNAPNYLFLKLKFNLLCTTC